MTDFSEKNLEYRLDNSGQQGQGQGQGHTPNENKIPSGPIIATLCCLSALGLREKVVSSFSFFPPKLSGLVLRDQDGSEIEFKKEYLHKRFGLEKITLRSVTKIEKRLEDLLVGERKADIFCTWLESGKSKIPISCISISPIHKGDEAKDKIPTFIFSHGNATDIGSMLPWFVNLSLKLNAHVLAYDYRSYGLSKGKPTERGIYADIKAVYEYARDVLKFPTDQIFLLGQSIGSAPTIYLARKLGKKLKKSPGAGKVSDKSSSDCNKSGFPLGGIIVQSGIASGLNALLAPDYKKDIPCDVFPNYRNIRKVPFPILILHGTSDQVIHISNSKKLFENAKENKFHPPVTTWWIEGANHNLPGPNPKKEYYLKIGAFINSVI
ncbi:peptidase of the alpha beta-hydrolase fold [Cryptosporidium sp. chipmunk genotype I]|uniref:peptidase of the alpha beta-hydrolase fold n=1 Tax=Cryptosporidium sp. chipmunk genotype I TaxID=1280935 RepID=UPI00351A04E3|nr:peptidase of the alpha beta-hydrolase fold [Cryptosporidium sp. chipmunk genotype I]